MMRPPGGLDREPSGAEARVKRRASPVTASVQHALGCRWRRLTRGARVRYASSAGRVHRRDLRNFHRTAMPAKSARPTRTFLARRPTRPVRPVARGGRGGEPASRRTGAPLKRPRLQWRCYAPRGQGGVRRRPGGVAQRLLSRRGVPTARRAGAGSCPGRPCRSRLSPLNRPADGSPDHVSRPSPPSLAAGGSDRGSWA